jgi:hypothetical protein
MSITEVPTENSGFYKGKIVAPTRIRKHGTKLEDNQFFTPKDFAIGKHRIYSSTFILCGFKKINVLGTSPKQLITILIFTIDNLNQPILIIIKRMVD